MNLHTKSHEAATIIARYVYPDCEESTAAAVGQRFFIEPQARLDVADIECQIAWYKAQGLIAKGVNARAVVDLNFVK